jgi:hypothetical protein
MSDTLSINIGICGFGTVGQGVWKHVEARRDALEARLGVKLNLVRASVRDLKKRRAVRLPASKLTTDPLSIANDPSIDVVCELMGGTGIAREVTLAALRNGKVVVSANKALISEHGAAVSWMGTRALVTYASIAALVAGSVLLERPAPHARVPAADSVTVEATANRIETKGGGQALSLLHGGAGEVTFTVSAQGSMRARYVDSETDCVTINSVYAQ